MLNKIKILLQESNLNYKITYWEKIRKFVKRFCGFSFK